MKKLKLKLLTPFLSFSILAFGALNSQALVLSYLDVGTDYDSDGNSITGDFVSLQYKSETQSTQFDNDGDGLPSTGDQILDIGDAWINSLITTSDDEGLDSNYGFTFSWDDVQGRITGVGPAADPSFDEVIGAYTGGNINFYLDSTLDHNWEDAGGAGNGDGNIIGPAELDMTDNTGFTDGDHVATIEITGGGFENLFEAGTANFVRGSFELNGNFSYLAPGFWFDAESDTDWNDKLFTIEWLVAFTDGDTDGNFFRQDAAAGEGALFNLLATHDASIDLDVVPEPTTLVLFGAGLLGLAGFGRRKFTGKK